MEAKDTVMKNDKLQVIIQVAWEELTSEDLPPQIEMCLATPMLEAQAEISFKAGFNEALDTVVATREYDEGEQAGIKEVVEFIHKEFGGYTKAVADGGKLINILIDSEYGENGSLEKWQAKLKEWGIK